MWAPFPGNEAHKPFFWGPERGVLGGGQKVYAEKVYVLFRSPVLGRSRMTGRRKFGSSRPSLGVQVPRPSFPSFPRENRSSKNVWENTWKSQTSFLQTSAAFWWFSCLNHKKTLFQVLRRWVCPGQWTFLRHFATTFPQGTGPGEAWHSGSHWGGQSFP